MGLPTWPWDFPISLPNQFNRGYFYFRQTEIGLYFNDNWKVTPRLTLNFGVRWDNWTPYTEKFDRLVAVDIDTVASKFEVITPGSVDIYSLRDVPRSVLDSWSARGLTYTTADQIGYPSKLFAGDYNNFAPRLGAAFKLTDKTVLRGGYGEYFWPMPLNQLLQASRSNPPLNLRYTNEPQFFDGFRRLCLPLSPYIAVLHSQRDCFGGRNRTYLSWCSQQPALGRQELEGWPIPELAFDA